MDDKTLRNVVNSATQLNKQKKAIIHAPVYNPAADYYTELSIDLNELLVKNKQATYFFRMHSEAMTDAGIYPGDILIVDRSLPVVNGKIIVAGIDGELIVRRYQQELNNISLLTANNRYGAIQVMQLTNFCVWGVVTFVIHAVR